MCIGAHRTTATAGHATRRHTASAYAASAHGAKAHVARCPCVVGGRDTTIRLLLAHVTRLMGRILWLLGTEVGPRQLVGGGPSVIATPTIAINAAEATIATITEARA